MHNLQLILQESQTPHHAGRDPGEDLLIGDSSLVDPIERSSVHELHAVVDARLDEESSVELDDLGSDRSMEDIQFHEDSVEARVVDFETDFLKRGKGQTQREGKSSSV